MLQLVGTLVAVAAIFGWISTRFLKLPNTVGTMCLTVASSVLFILVAPVWPVPRELAVHLARQINFEQLILNGLLPLLLFAGASLLDLDALRNQKLAVAVMAVLGTTISVASVGAITYVTSRWVGFHPSWLEALLFGALISPTDPIAVLEMLQRVQTPKYLAAQLGGESLFNDGVGAVVFLSLLAATHGEELTFSGIAVKIVLSIGGGLILGVVFAYLTSLLMRNVNNPAIDVMLSLALALCGYAFTEHLGASAPIETVTAALSLRLLVEREPTERIAHQELRHFWSMLDEIQNAVLFLLLGCGFLVIEFTQQAFVLGGLSILTVNLVRILAVALCLALIRTVQPGTPSSLSVLSWGGLRGGLSIALALIVPKQFGGTWILQATYILVVFSVLVQGSTMGMFLRSRNFSGAAPEMPEGS